MYRLTRFVRLVSMVLWVGGITFFAFVVAPVAFGKLASAHEAGLVVGGTLRVLHLVGLGCGVVFVLLTGVVAGRIGSRRQVAVELVLTLAMLAVTAYSQFAVLPAMERYRAEAGGDISTTDRSNPGWIEFERLHRLSERLEGLVLVCGLGVIFALAGEAGTQRDAMVRRV